MFGGELKQPTQKTSASAPDSFMRNFQYQSHSADGIVNSILTSIEAVHFPKDDLTKFAKPKLTYFTKDRQTWVVTSDKGRSINGDDKIFLSQNVLIHQPQTAISPDTKIYTQHLTVYPGTDIAITNDPVLIKRPGTVIHGIGMTANLKTGQYKLLHQARGIYDPEA